MKLLIKFQRDWSDEFDVYGWAIKTKEDWAEDVDLFERGYHNKEWYFGSNEFFYIDSDFLSNFTVTEITEETETTLRSLFKLYNDEYGHFPQLNME